MAYGRNNLASLKLNPLEKWGSVLQSDEQKKQPQTNAQARKRQRDALKALPPTILLLPAGLQRYITDQYNARYQGKPGNHGKRLAKYLLLCHLVWSEQQKAGTLDAIHLHNEILRLHIGKDKGFSYTDVVEDLKEWSVLEVSDSYLASGCANRQVDPHSKAYTFADSFHGLESEFVAVDGLRYRERAAQDRLKRQIAKNQAKGLRVMVVDEQQPHLQWLKACWERCDYSPNTDELINQMEREQTYLRDVVVKVKGVRQRRTDRRMTPRIAQAYRDSLELFRRNKANHTPEWHFSATNGRLHSFFNRYFTGSRDHVTLDGQAMVWADLDLAASQVYFLLKQLYATRAAGQAGPDLDAFRDLVLAEGFYQNLAGLIQKEIPGLPINDAKTDFFTHVIYSKNHQATPYRGTFNHLFPTVHAALLEIVRYKVKGVTKFRNLAVLLQQEESQVFLQTICRRIHDELGHHQDLVVLPVHDGLCVPQQYQEPVRAIMNEELLRATGFQPTVRTTPEKKAKKEAKKAAATEAREEAVPAAPVQVPAPVEELACEVGFEVAPGIWVRMDPALDVPPNNDPSSPEYVAWLLGSLFMDPPGPSVQEPVLAYSCSDPY
ncbi:hypothetical protein [Hymenobacter wooponensis]|uniref:Uncharacterized protein n=1 Tax=Hymenobacter wooponensis TaxID=1525360 RepID=A0A4Z0MNP7_9BACT|nr:hypothetical protein [Hymenobacter wooponensis]TGD80825.1 hypothetical protein EU557_13560 [Hymenobacter wooponensis]